MVYGVVVSTECTVMCALHMVYGVYREYHQSIYPAESILCTLWQWWFSKTHYIRTHAHAHTSLRETNAKHSCLLCHSVVGQSDCPALTLPAYATMTVTGNSFGNTTSFVCNKPYNLVGSAIRVCEINGQWSGVQPTCSSM